MGDNEVYVWRTGSARNQYVVTGCCCGTGEMAGGRVDNRRTGHAQSPPRGRRRPIVSPAARGAYGTQAVINVDGCYFLIFPEVQRQRSLLLSW